MLNSTFAEIIHDVNTELIEEAVYMQKLNTAFDMVLMREYSLCCEAEYKVYSEGGDFSDLDWYYTEAENATAENKKNILERIWDAITDIIKKIFDSIGNIFGLKADIPDDTEITVEKQYSSFKPIEIIQKGLEAIPMPIKDGSTLITAGAALFATGHELNAYIEQWTGKGDSEPITMKAVKSMSEKIKSATQKVESFIENLRKAEDDKNIETDTPENTALTEDEIKDAKKEQKKEADEKDDTSKTSDNVDNKEEEKKSDKSTKEGVSKEKKEQPKPVNRKYTDEELRAMVYGDKSSSFILNEDNKKVPAVADNKSEAKSTESNTKVVEKKIADKKEAIKKATEEYLAFKERKITDYQDTYNALGKSKSAVASRQKINNKIKKLQTEIAQVKKNGLPRHELVKLGFIEASGDMSIKDAAKNFFHKSKATIIRMAANAAHKILLFLSGAINMYYKGLNAVASGVKSALDKTKEGIDRVSGKIRKEEKE